MKLWPLREVVIVGFVSGVVDLIALGWDSPEDRPSCQWRHITLPGGAPCGKR